jgi:hypothetical protein
MRGATALAIGFAAMLYGEDFEGVVPIVKAKPVVAEAQAELRRFDVLESLDIAFTASDESGERVQDAECCLPINSAELGLICS